MTWWSSEQFFMLQFLRRTFGYYILICFCYINILDKKWSSKIVSNYIFHILANIKYYRIVVFRYSYHVSYSIFSFLDRLLLILYRERTFSLITMVMELSRDLKTNHVFDIWCIMNSGILIHLCILSHTYTHTYDNTQNRLINDFYKVNVRKSTYICLSPMKGIG